MNPAALTSGTPARAWVDEIAREEGFDVVGFTVPDAAAHAAAHLARFLEAGRHGDMEWMHTTAERRMNPSTLWPQANSVIMLGMNYHHDGDPLEVLKKPTHGGISVYAQGRDYHDIFKKKLKRFARRMVDASRPNSIEVKVFVDTAPVMEKPLAQAAGIGWQGKHTNLVSRDYGSWLFLGAVFTTLEIAPHSPAVDACGQCRACLDICPTQAFPKPYELDARRCISYLTIEHKGHIPVEFRKPMANRIYGCDDCLAVCPWNKFAKDAHEAMFARREELNAPQLRELVRLDDTAFRNLFAGSPVKRTGRARFIRNVLIAIGNSSDAGLIRDVEYLLHDESALVRAMAVWALGCLSEDAQFQSLRAQYEGAEVDSEVRAEWGRAYGAGVAAPFTSSPSR